MYFGDQAKQEAIHVLVDVILSEDLPKVENLSLSASSEFTIPESNLSFDWDAIKNEIAHLPKWTTRATHEIPVISHFMKGFGGCTNGKIYWREEEKQVMAHLLTDIFEEDVFSCFGSEMFVTSLGTVNHASSMKPPCFA